MFVQLAQCQEDACRVELGDLLIKLLEVLQVEKQFTSWTVVNHHIQTSGVLESEIQIHNKGMSDLFQDPSFSPGSLLLLVTLNPVFLDHLHCVYSLVRNLIHQKHLPICSNS